MGFRKNNIFKQLREYFKAILNLKGFIEVFPILLVFYYLFSTSLIPVNLYYRFFSKPIFEHYFVNLLTLISPFILIFLFVRFRANITLVVFSAIFFALCTFSSFFADEPSLNSIIIGYYTVLPFLICSFVQFTKLQITTIRIFSLILLSLICFQVYFYGLGFGTYISKFGDGTSLGEAGIASRVYTTVGAATGTSVLIILLSFLLLSLRTNLGKLEIAVIILMCSSVFITYSRGSLLIILAFVLLKYNPFSNFRFFFKRIFTAIALFFVLSISLGGILIFNPSVLKVWEDRLHYLSAREFDSGRFLRVDHAMVEFERSDYLGVGFGNYSARKKIIPTVFTRMTFVGLSSPHNVFILLLVELGVFGLIAYLIFVCKILFSSLRKNSVLAILIPIFLIGHNVEYVYLMYPFLWAFALLIATALSRNMPERSLV